MTLESLNELAENTLDSKNTIPGEILFFRQDSSIGESLKKLKNHNFKIGYSFTIDICGKEFTKIVAYNQKNDIFSGWAGFVNQDGEMKEVFPIIGNGFSCYLNMPRIDELGKLKLYRENMVSVKRQNSYAKRMFNDLENLSEIDDLSLYGLFWPILENPSVEEYRRRQQSDDRELYCDISVLCNIYKFDETYMLLDDGLKRIYRLLYEKREEYFCREYMNYYENVSVIKGVLEYLDLDECDIRKLFEKNHILFSAESEKPKQWKISMFKTLEKFAFSPKGEKNHKI